jgi:maleylpyruvate isomerase
MNHAETARATLHDVAEATERLLRTVRPLPEEAVTAPSALPGWTVGHVLTHLARNADSLVNLLDSARTGEDIPQYPSTAARDQDIEDGSPRPLAVQYADLVDSDARFTAAAAKLPDAAWGAQLTHRTGYVFPAYELPWKRLAELEYHHVDLAVGYTPAHWPERFATAEFTRLAQHFAGAAGLPATLLTAEDAGLTRPLGEAAAEPELRIEGPVRALVAWLSGRSEGDGLQVHRGAEQLTDPRVALPKLPPMA